MFSKEATKISWNKKKNSRCFKARHTTKGEIEDPRNNGIVILKL